MAAPSNMLTLLPCMQQLYIALVGMLEAGLTAEWDEMH